MEPALSSLKPFSYTSTALVVCKPAVQCTAANSSLLFPLWSAHWIHTKTSHISLRYILMLSSQLSWCRQPQAPREISISSMHAECPVHLIPLHSTILIIFREQCKLSRFLSSSIIPSSVCLSLSFRFQYSFSACSQSLFKPCSEPIRKTEGNQHTRSINIVMFSILLLNVTGILTGQVHVAGGTLWVPQPNYYYY